MKTVYQARCIEDGERFVTYFKTATKDKEKLREMGQELAVTWGAECLSVTKYKGEPLRDDEVADVDKDGIA